MRTSPPIAALLFSPKPLAQAALTSSTPAALLWGTAAFLVQILPPLSALAGSIGEPYRDLTDYLRHALAAAPACALFVSVPMAVIVCLLLKARLSRADTLGRRALFLCPVTTLIPGALWAVFASLAVFATPANDFYGPGGKPAWLSSPVLLLLGSPLWLIVGVAVLVHRYTRACRALELVLKDAQCVECGYALTGNESGRCPECGLPAAARVIAAGQRGGPR